MGHLGDTWGTRGPPLGDPLGHPWYFLQFPPQQIGGSTSDLHFPPQEMKDRRVNLSKTDSGRARAPKHLQFPPQEMRIREKHDFREKVCFHNSYFFYDFLGPDVRK